MTPALELDSTPEPTDMARGGRLFDLTKSFRTLLGVPRRWVKSVVRTCAILRARYFARTKRASTEIVLCSRFSDLVAPERSEMTRLWRSRHCRVRPKQPLVQLTAKNFECQGCHMPPAQSIISSTALETQLRLVLSSSLALEGLPTRAITFVRMRYHSIPSGLSTVRRGIRKALVT